MLVAAFRLIGPLVAGPVYYWSVVPNNSADNSAEIVVRSFPFNYWFVFLLIAFMYSLLFGASYFFPQHLDVPPKKTEEIELDEISD